MATLLDSLDDKQAQKDIGRGLLDAANRGAVAGLLGGPVDIATMALRPLGYSVEKPVGGSEWIGGLMQDAGMVSDQRNPVAEALAGVAFPGGAFKGARGLSALSDMSPNITGSGGGYRSIVNQMGAMSPEGEQSLLKALTTRTGIGNFRMGDVTAGQDKALGNLKVGKRTNQDVFATDDLVDHLIERRMDADGFTPEQVVRFVKQAMAKRSKAEMTMSKEGGYRPALINRDLRHMETGEIYHSTLPLYSDGESLIPVTVIPKNLNGPNKKAPKK